MRKTRILVVGEVIRAWVGACLLSLLPPALTLVQLWQVSRTVGKARTETLEARLQAQSAGNTTATRQRVHLLPVNTSTTRQRVHPSGTVGRLVLKSASIPQQQTGLP